MAAVAIAPSYCATIGDCPTSVPRSSSAVSVPDCHVPSSGRPSGMVVYPKLPIPKGGGPTEPKVKGFKTSSNDGFSMTKVIAGLLIAVVIGAGVGFLIAPSKAGDLTKAKKDLAAAQAAAKVEK